MTVIGNAGKYKQPITFQKKRLIGDGGGSYVEEWDGWAADRVRVLPVSAAERIRSHREEVQITHLLEGRYRDDIDEAMRISYKGRILDIKWIINVAEENVENQYLCVEIK
jgi:SPP1 family predicted phage head-tail adaptor